MDYDSLVESARVARLAGNVEHETDAKRKVAVALALARPEWLIQHGLSMRQGTAMLGENNARIAEQVKAALRAEMN